MSRPWRRRLADRELRLVASRQAAKSLHAIEQSGVALDNLGSFLVQRDAMQTMDATWSTSSWLPPYKRTRPLLNIRAVAFALLSK
jgi:hypothetical protein